MDYAERIPIARSSEASSTDLELRIGYSFFCNSLRELEMCFSYLLPIQRKNEKAPRGAGTRFRAIFKVLLPFIAFPFSLRHFEHARLTPNVPENYDILRCSFETTHSQVPGPH